MQGHLYAGMCTGVGLVHFAEDKNPRSVYEAVQAGLPVFINKEAQVSKDLEEQPFVVVSAHHQQQQRHHGITSIQF